MMCASLTANKVSGTGQCGAYWAMTVFMGQIGILASYKELTGREADRGEFRRTVANYELGALLALCCRLHIILRTWQNPPDYQAEASLLPRVFDPDGVRV
jgi:hypothetical protein